MHNRNVNFSSSESVFRSVSSSVFAMSFVIKSPRKRPINHLDVNIDLVPAKRRRIAKTFVPMPIIGRTFYHMQTLQPFSVKVNDELEDSDDDYEEIDQIRLQKSIHDRLLEVTNEGERKLMNLWNTFIGKYKIMFGDGHIRMLCRLFIDCHVRDIVRQKIYRNFVLHLTSLYDFELLSASDVMELVQQMREHMKIDSKPMTSSSPNESKSRDIKTETKKSKSPPKPIERTGMRYGLRRAANSTALG